MIRDGASLSPRHAASVAAKSSRSIKVSWSRCGASARPTESTTEQPVGAPLLAAHATHTAAGRNVESSLAARRKSASASPTDQRKKAPCPATKAWYAAKVGGSGEGVADPLRRGSVSPANP